MNPTPEAKAAFASVAGTATGKAIYLALKSHLDVIMQAMIRAEDPHQVRRLQGEARNMTEVITLFTHVAPK